MKSRSAIKLGVLLLVFLILAYVGLVGIPVGVYDILPFATQAYKGADISQGTVINIDPMEVAYESGVQEADVEKSVEIMRERLELYGLTSATVTRDGLGARVILPVSSVSRIEETEYYSEDIGDFVATPGRFEVLNPNDEVVFDQSHFVDGTVYTNADSEVVVELLLNDEGKQLLQEATTEFTGEDFTAQLDGMTVATETMSVVIENGIFSTTGFQTEEAAERFLAQLRSGVLPVEMVVTNISSVTAPLGESTIYVTYQVFLIAAAVIALLFLILFRLPGLISVFTLACYMLLVMFMTALFDFELALPAIIAFIIGFAVCAALNAIDCMKLKNTLSRKGMLASNLAEESKSMLAVLADVHAILFMCAFVLLCFTDALLLNFGIGLLIAVIVSFIVNALLPRFIRKQFFNLNVRKPWLYAVKEGGEK